MWNTRENDFSCHFTREFRFVSEQQRHGEDKKKKKEIFNWILLDVNSSKHIGERITN